MGSIFFRMENNCSGSYDYLELFKSFVGVWEIFFSPEWFRIENNCSSGNYDYSELFKAFVGLSTQQATFKSTKHLTLL